FEADELSAAGTEPRTELIEPREGHVEGDSAQALAVLTSADADDRRLTYPLQYRYEDGWKLCCPGPGGPCSPSPPPCCSAPRAPPPAAPRRPRPPRRPARTPARPPRPTRTSCPPPPRRTPRRSPRSPTPSSPATTTGTRRCSTARCAHRA